MRTNFTKLKKPSFKTLFFLFCSAFSGLSGKTYASHYMGGEFSYNAVAPGVYMVQFKAYYDCLGATPPTSMAINIVSPGCNTGSVITANQVGSSGTSINPYCRTIGNACSSTGPFNVRLVNYQTTLTFSATQQQCTDWYLSASDCTRYPTANLQNSANNCNYTEAYINLNVGGAQISSPQFVSNPHLFFTTNSPATINNLANSANLQDSVVYTLKPSMINGTTPYTYTTGLSATQPIYSSTPVSLHPRNGLLTFTPNMHFPAVPPNQGGANTYEIVVEAATYRKINGVPTKVAAVQRNLPVMVVDNNPNENPELVMVIANGQSVAPNAVIEVPVSSLFTMQFNTADVNPSDSLELSLPTFAQNGFIFTLMAGSRPSGAITWRAPATPSEKILYFPIVVRDNACPVRGVKTHMYGLKVVAAPNGIKDAASMFNFRAVPNPFSEQVAFQFSHSQKVQQVIISNLLGQKIDIIDLKPGLEADATVNWSNASKHPPGTYVARLIAADKTIQTLKFIKIK